MAEEQKHVVVPGNRPRRAAARRPDPDGPAPAPAPPAVPQQTAAPETQPTPAPAPAPAPARAPARDLAPTEPPAQGPDVLASMLASKQPPDTEEAAAHRSDTQLSLQAMIRARKRRVDPFTDYAADGTRQLKWIQDTVDMIADMTGRTKQEVYRDALLGVEPLNEELLDQFFADRYGYPRPRGGTDR